MEKLNSIQPINESIKNLFPENEKDKSIYIDQVWDILQTAYAKQGGILGRGFSNKEDMIKNIPYWKLDVLNGQVLSVLMYKFIDSKTTKNKIRKRVAVGVTPDKSLRSMAIERFKNIMKDEFQRSIVETSGASVKFLQTNFPIEFDKFKLTVNNAKQILFEDEIVPIDEYFYYRKIGGEFHEKIMVGTLKDVY